MGDDHVAGDAHRAQRSPRRRADQQALALIQTAA